MIFGQEKERRSRYNRVGQKCKIFINIHFFHHPQQLVLDSKELLRCFYPHHLFQKSLKTYFLLGSIALSLTEYRDQVLWELKHKFVDLDNLHRLRLYLHLHFLFLGNLQVFFFKNNVIRGNIILTFRCTIWFCYSGRHIPGSISLKFDS